MSLELNDWIAGKAGVGLGGQRAVDSRDPHHHAPVAVEIVAKPTLYPLGLDFLVRIERRRGLGTADVILRLVAAPIFEEDSAAMILLLRHIEAADVEHAATAGAGARRRRREADKRHERQDDWDEARD